MEESFERDSATNGIPAPSHGYVNHFELTSTGDPVELAGSTETGWRRLCVSPCEGWVDTRRAWRLEYRDRASERLRLTPGSSEIVGDTSSANRRRTGQTLLTVGGVGFALGATTLLAALVVNPPVDSGNQEDRERNEGKRDLQTGLAVGGLVVMGLATLTALAGAPLALSDGDVDVRVKQKRISRASFSNHF